MGQGLVRAVQSFQKDAGWSKSYSLSLLQSLANSLMAIIHPLLWVRVSFLYPHFYIKLGFEGKDHQDCLQDWIQAPDAKELNQNESKPTPALLPGPCQRQGDDEVSLSEQSARVSGHH